MCRLIIATHPRAKSFDHAVVERLRSSPFGAQHSALVFIAEGIGQRIHYNLSTDSPFHNFIAPKMQSSSDIFGYRVPFNLPDLREGLPQ